MQPHRNGRWVRQLTALFALLLLAITPGALIAPVSAASAPIDPEVTAALNTQKQTTVWIMMRAKADLRPAYAMKDWEARGRFVYERLQATANASQAEMRNLLQSRGVKHRPFFILNAIQATIDNVTLNTVASHSEVERIISDTQYQIPQPIVGQSLASTQAIEWNIARIRAPEAWEAFGARGDGIVIANIDTGVQFDHPALVRQYRGNQGGSFEHSYNWFDPSAICSPGEPCDNIGHGSHTMGTMIGEDSTLENQVGVAPRARWIAAKGCETNDCSTEALVASGEWILAPKDLSGQNPRPDLRPHIVNNSWGGGGGDPFYKEIVSAWVASGIFPVFANGNDGPGCQTAGSPGDYPESYAVGAFDNGDAIAAFSSRGGSAFSGLKPNIAAPGVDVRSTVPGDGYSSFSGTSMAAPHVAGVVALIWSVAPSLLGDVAGTRTLLDQTAVDTEDLSCGGEPTNNNVWGEGKLDAYSAVDFAPRGPTGILTGSVRDPNGEPVVGARIDVSGPTQRVVFSDAAGLYTMVLPVGRYDLAARAFGYIEQSVSGIDILEGQTTERNFTLEAAPAYPVAGVVRDQNGEPLANATVTILNTPLAPVTTDASGAFSFTRVPLGEYELRAEAGRCNNPQTLSLTVDGPEELEFTLDQRSDSFGYFCEITGFDYTPATQRLPFEGDDAATMVPLPFAFSFYGETYQRAYVSTNGFVNFLRENNSLGNGAIPSPDEPNAAIYPFWDDLVVDGAGGIYIEERGAAPNRQFVIEWRNTAFCCVSAERLTFQAILFENGHILTQYTEIDDNGRERGDSATVGIENADGSIGLQYSLNEAALNSGLAVRYLLPPSGFVQGQVRDANDGAPVAGALVRALQDGAQVRATTTDADGFYRLMVPVGRYTIEVSARNYSGASATVNVALDATVTQDFELRAPRIHVSPTALELIVPVGETRTRTLTLSNNGSFELVWTISEQSVASLERKPLTTALGTTSTTTSQGYKPRATREILAGGPTLVLMDAYPWGSDAMFRLLAANGIAYDLVGSGQMGDINLDGYEAVFIANDQPQAFYDAYNVHNDRFATYVNQGGFLWFGAAAWGSNGGNLDGASLPGGTIIHGLVVEEVNTVNAPEHPVMQGVPNPFVGNGASHAYFSDYPPETTVIARGDRSGEPTLIEYSFGAGKVLALAQPLEFGWSSGNDLGRILENSLPYAYAYEPGIDLPWLVAQPTAGTLQPNQTQQIQVTLDTRGLEPGLYRARLAINSNDPRSPQTLVPITLIVPAYRQAVNVGGTRYGDGAGDAWAADQAYRTGTWGYLGRTRITRTNAPIAGTSDDSLYQRARTGQIIEYRFDRVPAGVYQIELRFAEIQNIKPDQRVFDVAIEGGVALLGHDIVSQVGRLRADNHTFFVRVEDGQLNIRLLTRHGFGQPIINAVRVTHRPDR